MTNFYKKINKENGVLNVNKESKSVLKLVSEKNINENEEFMENGFTKYQKEAFDRGVDLIIEKLSDKPFLSAYAYRTLCLVSYSRDKNLFDKIKSFTDAEYIDFLKDKNTEIVNHLMILETLIDFLFILLQVENKIIKIYNKIF